MSAALAVTAMAETFPAFRPARGKTPLGPIPVRGPGRPLALGRNARVRLRAAMRALLDLDGLDGVVDAVRLAVLVLASRTPSESGVVEIRTSELARWLGLSMSYVASVVVPALRRSGVVSVETAPGEYGQADGLRCRVLPLWAAQDVTGHPLNLAKKEYATLLRLLEAVMGPGWTHRDGSVTPAGLIGTRTGRGAATDRLALLLLVLEARETGRARLCGGAVDTKRGRAAATVARLLGCSVSAGERVLERLEERELVLRVRLKTGSGLASRARLMVPAVAAAHGRTVGDDVQEDRAQALEPELSDPDVAAGPCEARETETEPQVSGLPVTDVADVTEPDVAAALHTDHPHLGTPVVSPQLSCGFSGEGRWGEGHRPERACVREDQGADGGSTAAGIGSPVAQDGPLRGEKPKESPADEDDGQRAAGAGAGGQPRALGWEKAQQQWRVALPADLGLRVALGPVTGLWEQLSGWQQDQVEAAAKAELARLAGLVMRPESVPQILADRLTDRLAETGGEALVDQPFPWLIRRGLVQRPACSDPRCDDGTRLDTRSECPSCATAIADRRALRARVRAAVTAEQGQRPVSRAAYEERLREHSALETDRARARHARAAVEVERRRAAVAERRQREQEAEQARLSAPCVDCGLADAAGLCPRCSWTRRTEVLVAEAVDLAVAARSVLDDPEEVAGLSEACGARVRELVTEGCRRQVGDGVDEVIAAFTSVQVAERVRDVEQADALRRLAAGPEAEAEAAAVLAAELRRSPRQLEAARAAGEAARHRAAEYLLRHRLGQLRVLRARAEAGRPLRRVS
ncbi:hypothetical protein ACFY4K_33560 [Streptomyces leeuwenhoekii]|uniref:hypothetical protein n=1 Tax=Streptomyces leeuwenhoekii TaxID=1437453 RepID=UPI0036B66C9E